MSAQERGITVFFDIDNTQNQGWGIGPVRLPLIPWKTTLGLLRGNFSVPGIGQPMPEVEVVHSGLVARVNGVWHGMRSFTEDSEMGLAVFQAYAQRSDRQIETAILSGRDLALHEMTRRELESSGRMRFFNAVHLSTVRSSSGFKERVATEKIQEGRNVVLIEDDLGAALRVGQLIELCEEDQTVMVFLLRNFSNREWFLNRAGVVVPENVKLVSSFSIATKEIVEAIGAGRL